MGFQVGDRVILEDIVNSNYDRMNLPFGTNESKVSFMDGKTIYVVRSVQKDEIFKQRIQLEGAKGRLKNRVRGDKKYWSYSPRHMTMAERIVNDKVFGILKGERV